MVDDQNAEEELHSQAKEGLWLLVPSRGQQRTKEQKLTPREERPPVIADASTPRGRECANPMTPKLRGSSSNCQMSRMHRQNPEPGRKV